MKALSKIRDVSEILSRHGIESAEKEARLFITHSLAADLVDIYRDNPEIKHETGMEIDEMVARRTRREPLQYIVGHVDFMGLKISLGREVLIPRPETEMMVEDAVKVIRDQQSGAGGQGSGVRGNRKRTTMTECQMTKNARPQAPDPRPLMILDLCTGSGCIALALAREFPAAQVYGVDFSEAAISYARKNALDNDIVNAHFICGTMFDAIMGGQLFDLIIANPPYIPSSDIKNLEPEVKQWEPRTALDGGVDGLDAYRSIIPQAGHFLKNNGILILELGIGLARPVAGMAEHAGFSGINITKDLAGIERTFRAEWIK